MMRNGRLGATIAPRTMLLPDDDLGADRNALVKVGNVGVDQPETAGRNRGADGVRPFANGTKVVLCLNTILTCCELIKAHGFAAVFLTRRQFHAHRQTRDLLDLARSPDRLRAYTDGRLRARLWVTHQSHEHRQTRDLLDPARPPDLPSAYTDGRLRAHSLVTHQSPDHRQTRDLLDLARSPEKPAEKIAKTHRIENE